MADKIQLLLEAERRGILPPDKKPLLDEARRRGLVGGQSGSVPSYQQYREDLGFRERERPDYLSKSTAVGALQSAGSIVPFSREITSGISTALGYDPDTGDYFDYSEPVGKRYKETLAAERGHLKQFRKDRPYTSMVAETAGALPVGFGIARAVPAARTALGRIGQGTGASGLMGLSYGLGTSEGGAADRLASANRTGLIAALLGGGISGGFEAAPALWNVGGQALSRVVGRKGMAQKTPALRKLAQALLRQNPAMSPDEAMTHARMRFDELGPEAVAGDIGKQTRMLTGTIYRQGGAPQQVIHDKVVPRQVGVRDPETEVLSGGQYGRVSQMLDDLVPEDTLATRAGLQKPTAEGSRFYDEAYAANQKMDSPALRRILKNPVVADALDVAREIMQGRGKNLGRSDAELTALARELNQIGKMGDEAITGQGIARGLKLETLDLVKRALDRVAKTGTRSDDALKVQRAINAGRLAKQLRTELDRLDVTARAGPKSTKIEGGAYQRARAAEQTRLRAKDAFKSGEHFLTKADFRNPKEMEAVLADMSPEELNALRISGAGVLKRIIGDVPINRDVTRKLFNIPNLEQKVRLLFGDPKTFARYIRGNRSEREMYQLYSEIMGGSQTQERQAALRALRGEPSGAAGTALDVMTRAPARPWSTAVEAIPRAGRAVMEWASKMPESSRMELARALMGRDLAPLMEQTQAAYMGSEAKRRLAQALMGTNVALTPSRVRGSEMVPAR